jgi:hypothetical protein
MNLLRLSCALLMIGFLPPVAAAEPPERWITCVKRERPGSRRVTSVCDRAFPLLEPAWSCRDRETVCSDIRAGAFTYRRDPRPRSRVQVRRHPGGGCQLYDLGSIPSCEAP